MERLRGLLGEEAGFVREWMELGHTLRRLDDRTQALMAYEQAEKLDPKHLRSKLDSSIELRVLKRFKEAHHKIDSALALVANHPVALFHLGELYRAQGQYQKALEQFQKVIAIRPNYAEARLQIAVVYRELADWKSAEAELTAILQDHPSHFSALTQLGGILERHQDRHQQALGWFQQAKEAAKSNPQRLQSRLQIIEELRDLNQLEEAVTVAKALAQEHPQEVSPKLRLATIYHQQQRFEEAVQVFREILEIQPDHLNAKIHLSRSLSELGQTDDSLEILNDSCSEP